MICFLLEPDDGRIYVMMQFSITSRAVWLRIAVSEEHQSTLQLHELLLAMKLCVNVRLDHFSDQCLSKKEKNKIKEEEKKRKCSKPRV